MKNIKIKKNLVNYNTCISLHENTISQFIRKCGRTFQFPLTIRRGWFVRYCWIFYLIISALIVFFTPVDDIELLSTNNSLVSSGRNYLEKPIVILEITRQGKIITS